MSAQISVQNVVLLLWGTLAFFWALSVIWVARDVRRRSWSLPAQLAAGLAALALPGFGVLAYLFLRPRTTLEQRYAQSLWLELVEQSTTPTLCRACGTEVERSFVACPVCGTSLRSRCLACRAVLEDGWLLCPYCETPVEGPETAPTRRGRRDEKPLPSDQPAPVAAPAQARRRSGAKTSVEPVPKRAA